MPVPAASIRADLDHHLAAHPEHAEDFAPLTELLDAGIDVTARDAWTGHVTASAIVEHDGRILVIKHRKYGGIWLQPGGHLEPGVIDDSLYGAALRELGEEAGLRDVRPVDTAPIHVAVHHVPASEDGSEPAHLHFDFRFGFTATTGRVQHDGRETDGVRWQHPDELENKSLRDAVDALWPALDRREARDRLGDTEPHRDRGVPMGVYLLLYDEQGRLLVGLRSDQVAVSPNMWAVPCGGREVNESAVAAIAREAYEELGVTIAPQDLRCVQVADVLNAYGPTISVYFVADKWSGTVENREPHKCLRLAWVSPRQPWPAPFVEHVQTVLDQLADEAAGPYSTIGWTRDQTPAGAR